MFVTLEEAADIVLQLAQENALSDDPIMNDPDLQERQERQREAINVIHDHFVNTVWEGTMENSKFSVGDKVISTVNPRAGTYTVLEVNGNGTLKLQHHEKLTTMKGGKVIEYHNEYDGVNPKVVELT